MRLRSVSLKRSLPLAAALVIGLVACGDTVVPALDEAERRLEGADGSEEGGEDSAAEGADSAGDAEFSCFVTMLYKKEGDHFVPKGGGRVNDPEHAPTDPCPAFVVSNGWASVDVCLSLDGGDGYAWMRWGGAVVSEVTLEKSFFTGNQMTVLSHDAGDAGYFEFRLSYHATCEFEFPGGPALTRKVVALAN